MFSFTKRMCLMFYFSLFRSLILKCLTRNEWLGRFLSEMYVGLFSKPNDVTQEYKRINIPLKLEVIFSLLRRLKTIVILLVRSFDLIHSLVKMQINTCENLISEIRLF